LDEDGLAGSQGVWHTVNDDFPFTGNPDQQDIQFAIDMLTHTGSWLEADQIHMEVRALFCPQRGHGPVPLRQQPQVDGWSSVTRRVSHVLSSFAPIVPTLAATSIAASAAATSAVM
jgi:hypothetical protein